MVNCDEAFTEANTFGERVAVILEHGGSIGDKKDGSLGWTLLGTLDHTEKENDKMGCFISKL